MHLHGATFAAAISIATCLAIGPACSDGISLPKRVVQKRAYVERHAAPFPLLPPCFEQYPMLLGCSPRVLLEGPPPLWVAQLQRSLLVKQRTPYPQLSPWPPYY